MTRGLARHACFPFIQHIVVEAQPGVRGISRRQEDSDEPGREGPHLPGAAVLVGRRTKNRRVAATGSGVCGS